MGNISAIGMWHRVWFLRADQCNEDMSATKLWVISGSFKQRKKHRMEKQDEEVDGRTEVSEAEDERPDSEEDPQPSEWKHHEDGSKDKATSGDTNIDASQGSKGKSKAKKGRKLKEPIRRSNRILGKNICIREYKITRG